MELGFILVNLGASNVVVSTSIIIPTFNGADWIGIQLESLSKQAGIDSCEVVVSDNGSTDQTLQVARSFEHTLNIVVVDATERKGNAAARNIGAAGSAGDLMIFVDQDDETQIGWLEAIRESAEIYELVWGNIPLAWDWDRRATLAVTGTAIQYGTANFLPYGLSSNMAIRRSALHDLGGFDEKFESATDLDLAWRASIAGTTVGFCDEAVVLKRPKTSGGFGQHRSFGRDDVLLYARFRSDGMPGAVKATVRRYGWLIRHIPRLFDHSIQRTWVRLAGRSVGRLEGSLKNRVFYP